MIVKSVLRADDAVRCVERGARTIMVSNHGGRHLDTTVTADMTVNGELHKLAHNISFGHGIHAGIHWRSDTDESILFGEQVAIAFLKAQIKNYAEQCNITIKKMDGTTQVFTN